MNLDRNEESQKFKFLYFFSTFEYPVRHALGLILALASLTEMSPNIDISCMK